MILYFKDSHKGTITRMCECRTEEEAFNFIATYIAEQLHFKSYYYNIWGDVNSEGGKWIDFGSHFRFFNLKEE